MAVDRRQSLTGVLVTLCVGCSSQAPLPSVGGGYPPDTNLFFSLERKRVEKLRQAARAKKVTDTNRVPSYRPHDYSESLSLAQIFYDSTP